MKVTLIIPENVDGLNGKNGLLRAHWSARKKKKESWSWLFLAQTHVRFKGKVNITITRSYKTTKMDYDNLVSTGKVPLDALVKAGIIEDDNSKIIERIDYRQAKIGKNDNYFFRIEIEQI